MIRSGGFNVQVEEVSETIARIVITQDQPPGHLPKKLADVRVSKSLLTEEMKAAKVI